MALYSRRLASVYQLSTQICTDKPSFATLNSSSDIIISCNPYNLNQLQNENYEYVFVFDIALDDLLAGNAGNARVVSHPIFQFMYNVNNFSSYPTINSLANGIARTTLPEPSTPLSLNLSKIISDPAHGGITGIQKIIDDCLGINFQFSGSFCPHIFSSTYSLLNPVDGDIIPVNRVVYAILDNNNRVLLFGTSISSNIFYSPFIG